MNTAKKQLLKNTISKNALSSNQLSSRRIIRSAKRLQQIVNNRNNNKSLKRKLNFSGEKEIAIKKSTEIVKQIRQNSNVSIEEGELLDTDVDEDCICIEPEIVQINLVDDDTMLGDENTLKPNEDISVAFAPKENCDMITSTPIVGNLRPLINALNGGISTPKAHKDIITSTPNNNHQRNNNNNELSMFYRDVQRNASAIAPLYETIQSEDTFTRYDKEEDVVEIIDMTNPPNSKKSSIVNETNNDSVIFVSEELPSTMPAFIPLETNYGASNLNPNKKPQSNVVNTPVAHVQSLLTASEQKNLKKYNSNMYNPNENAQITNKKRLIIIDGSNVAYGHGLSNVFSIKGLHIALNYFEKKGHEVKIVIPQMRLKPPKTSEQILLRSMYEDGKVILTPCKSLPGKSSTSYDDRFILQLAAELDGAVVSNDNYRDLINETSAFKKIIENRVIGYTWCNDMFILPMDPYGRWGPTLDSILNRI